MGKIKSVVSNYFSIRVNINTACKKKHQYDIKSYNRKAKLLVTTFANCQGPLFPYFCTPSVYARDKCL